MALSDVRVVNKGKDWISPEATAVAINPHKDDEYIVAKDDRTLSVWNFSGDKLQDSFDCNCIALSLAFSPPVMGSVATLSSRIGLESNYVIAAACSDGTLRILKRNGASTEKVVKAYNHGAATCAKWSLDGVSIVTAGEDGDVKVFSKTGNLRMNLASFNFAVHDVAWSPSGDAVAIACRNLICIHHTQKKKNPVRWQCHPDDHGAVLCVDWCPINHLLVCGSEDGKYRIFDAFGAILLESCAQMSAITSVSWSPKGEKIIVGLMGSLLLCNEYGQVLSKSSSNEGNYQLQWTADASRVLGLHGNGGIIQTNVIGREKEWNGFKMRQIGCCLISFQANGGDGSGDTTDEEIEYRDHIVDYEIGFQHAVVCCPKQCYVYDLYHLSNPITVDLKSVVSFVAMSATNFALVTRTQKVLMYSYDGRNLSLIDVNCTLSSGGFSRNHISLSKDYVVLVDPQDKTNVQILEARTGKKAGDLHSAIHHDAKIEFVSLSQSRSNQTQVKMLIIDEKKDLFLSSICPETGRRECELRKFGCHVSSAAWNEEYDQVAAISDSKIMIWYQINSLHDDLFSMASECIDCPGLGMNPRIANFAKASITVESSDGNKITTAISPVFETIHEYLLSNKWEKALHLCRFVENPKVWAMLTVLAIQNMNVEVAEAGLKACRLVDKLFHLQYIKSLKNEKEKQAELRKLCKKT